MTGTSLTIYVDRLCPYSNALQADLKRAHVHPELRVVDRDEDAAIEMYKLTKTNVTPVIRIVTEETDHVMIGYTDAHKKKIEELLKVKL